MFLFVLNAGSQVRFVDSLIYINTITVPHNYPVMGTQVYEISGIEYSGNGSQYLLLPQTKHKSYLYLCTIELEGFLVNYHFDGIVPFNAGGFEGESIRRRPGTSDLYLTDENADSKVYHLDKSGDLVLVYKSEIPLTENSGFEGMCFNDDGDKLYLSYERTSDPYETTIVEFDLDSGKTRNYSYKLDMVYGDRKNDNGISEILWIGKNSVLVIERAWLGRDAGTSVRVYRATFPETGNEMIKSGLITNFSFIRNLDNVEGVSFSASGNELYFITDNNGSKRQETQIICMKIQ